MPSIFHIFAHTIPVEERSRAFGYLVALGSIGQTVAALVSIALDGDVYYYRCESTHVAQTRIRCLKYKTLRFVLLTAILFNPCLSVHLAV